ncbi:hypothetical protein AtubIFM55763_002584 [Aspergillus tubingensis]|uniref:TauD/TfdA-like domain-containing protein n=2 Tax=Aspergillus tubingensis TaxID=5068 RepID=A0A9W6AXZ5_ASPTU|nr:hypothetical protein AtubIFM55763_002584 [Aspergillus tubingensis]GLA88987.1 hypothetical protein AtubIFM56815_003455 [Aspergillus tubingensis]GLA99251.1 hypothetical protein AtubIFM57143_007557 [Aspergillus tubingensis]
MRRIKVALDSLRARRCGSTRHLPENRLLCRQFAAKVTPGIPSVTAREMLDSQRRSHFGDIHHHLRTSGILKIRLQFPDDDSQYLERIILNLCAHHGHGPPTRHSASRGWFWDVRPSSAGLETRVPLARSETMQEFQWHTDCSYESAPPKYFALQVLQPDRYGGGTLSLMTIAKLAHHLSPAVQKALFEPEFKIKIPPEFFKQPDQQHIMGSILGLDKMDNSLVVRFREDLIEPMNPRAAAAYEELKDALNELAKSPQSMLHLTGTDLPEQSIVILDNHKWLHGRDAIKDPARHLRRVRWNAMPFPSVGQGDTAGS